jgi:hypothetical protein
LLELLKQQQQKKEANDACLLNLPVSRERKSAPNCQLPVRHVTLLLLHTRDRCWWYLSKKERLQNPGYKKIQFYSDSKQRRDGEKPITKYNRKGEPSLNANSRQQPPLHTYHSTDRISRRPAKYTPAQRWATRSMAIRRLISGSAVGAT